MKMLLTRKKYGIDKNLWKSELRIDNQVKYWFMDNWCCMLTSFFILILLLGSTLFFPIWTCFCETGNGMELKSMKNCSSQYVTLKNKRLENLNCGLNDCYTKHHYESFNQTGYCVPDEIIPTEISKFACKKSKNCKTAAGKVCSTSQQKRCKTCDIGYKLNTKSFECERTFCECDYGKPEAHTCNSVDTHKCQSCEYQFNLVEEKCVFCPGLYDRNDETCRTTWPGMSGKREFDENKQWVFLRKVDNGLKRIKERIYDTGTSSLNGLDVNVVLQNSFFDSTSGISRLEHTTGLFYIDPEAFLKIGLDQVVLPTEFCEDYSALAS